MQNSSSSTHDPDHQHQYVLIKPPHREPLSPRQVLAKPNFVIDLCLIFIVTVLYAVLLTMICKRKELQPLKVKNVRLIFCSVLSSGLLIISNLTIKILKNYGVALTQAYEKDDFDGLSKDATLDTLHQSACLIKTAHGCLFAPLMLLPYFFRAIKLKSLFDQHIKYTR